jgi:hypothetical protein
VPAAFGELVTLGRTLKKRAADVLAYFNHPGTNNGPTRAINGRLEHLRSSALGFRNLTSPDPYSRPAGSGRNYTLDREEPIFLLLSTVPFMRAWYGMYLFPEESALWVGRPALGAHSTLLSRLAIEYGAMLWHY